MKVRTNFEVIVYFPWHRKCDLVLHHSVEGNCAGDDEEELKFKDVLKLTLEGLTPAEQKKVKAKIARSFKRFLKELEK